MAAKVSRCVFPSCWFSWECIIQRLVYLKNRIWSLFDTKTQLSTVLSAILNSSSSRQCHCVVVLLCCCLPIVQWCSIALSVLIIIFWVLINFHAIILRNAQQESQFFESLFDVKRANNYLYNTKLCTVISN